MGCCKLQKRRLGPHDTFEACFDIGSAASSVDFPLSDPQRYATRVAFQTDGSDVRLTESVAAHSAGVDLAFGQLDLWLAARVRHAG